MSIAVEKSLLSLNFGAPQQTSAYTSEGQFHTDPVLSQGLRISVPVREAAYLGIAGLWRVRRGRLGGSREIGGDGRRGRPRVVRGRVAST